MRRAIAAAFISVACCLAITPANADRSHQWALSYLKADQVWQVTKGAGITIAVVDSGVKPNPDLPSNLLPGADYSAMDGNDIGDGHTDTDTDGHGTGMATVIAGSGQSNSGAGTIGLAPNASILPIRAESSIGAGLVFGIAPGVKFAIDHGARVINLSVGLSVDDPAIHKAINDAVAKDTVVVAAVGNSTSAPAYPAADPGVLGVGAIDETGAIWASSNTGTDVTLVAPGVHIYRDDNRNNQGYSDGTSEATAYVSAAAALVRSAHPTWTAPQVISALTSTAVKPPALDGQTRDDQYGYGIVNPLAAVELTAPPATTTQTATPTPTDPSATPATSATSTVGPAVGASRSSNKTTTLIGGAVLLLAAATLIAIPTLRRRR